MPHLERASFSGHETFPFRYTWPKKAVDHVTRDPEIFSREDAMVHLGVGKNMVHSVRHWAIATGLLEEKKEIPNNRGRALRVTKLGDAIFADRGLDPYLEDPGTLWLLHWQLANAPEEATTWYWVFNRLNRMEFTRGELADELVRLIAQHGWSRVSEGSVRRDVDTFVRTYSSPRMSKRILIEDRVECPLVDLGLLGVASDDETVVLRRQDHATLSAEIFIYGLIEYLNRRPNRTSSVSLEEILFAPGSPGRVFSLSEAGVLRRLDVAHVYTRGQLTYDETAGLKQIMVLDLPESLSALRAHYRRSKA
jgi:hypothetical protein